MRKKTLLISLILIDLAIWAGLLLFMNNKPPDSTNQLLFLIIWAVGTGLGATVISLALGLRVPGSRRDRAFVPRAARQGLLVGVLSAVLMALHFLRTLTLITAVVLIFVVVLVELLFYLKTR